MNVVNENSRVAAHESKTLRDRKPPASVTAYLMVTLIGTILGIVFVKSEVALWQRVHDMFLFKEPHMFLIIGTGVAVAMISLALIRRFEIKSLEQRRFVHYRPKPFHRGVMIGGVIFGAGWSITGACPGPIYAQLGGGELFAWFTFIGAMLGMLAFAYLKPKLPF